MNIVCCSFGKDSLATLYLMKEHGIKVDKIVFCDIWFNDKINGELPEHHKWIEEYMIPRLEKDFGKDVFVKVRHDCFENRFMKVKQKGPWSGTLLGWSGIRCRWCNDWLKRVPIRNYLKTLGGEQVVQYVGIAYDEVKRIPYALSQGQKLPMVDYKMTEAQAMEYCRKLGILSPAYKHRTRLGCWFCPLQDNKDIKWLYNNHPELWKELVRLDELSLHKFKMGKGCKKIEEDIKNSL